MRDTKIFEQRIKYMIRNTKRKISFYTSEKLSVFETIHHFFSTRNHGVSKGIFSSLNFGTHHGELSNMKKNLELLASSFQVGTERFVIPVQTHSDHIEVVDETNVNLQFENIDALITNTPGITIAVKTADCVPVLLFDPMTDCIAAIHVGWRGTAKNIVGKTIEKMKITFGTNPKNLIASIGPCISMKNYEVGMDVIDQIQQAFPYSTDASFFTVINSEKALLDLSQVNFELLKQAGVQGKNIEKSNLCTFSEKEDFFSARRDGPITGRMLSGITIIIK